MSVLTLLRDNGVTDGKPGRAGSQAGGPLIGGVRRVQRSEPLRPAVLHDAGGRRYYRPDDIALLRRISDLLYIQGYTIKGVQRLLREGGGRLSDDIPPAPEDEQEAAEAERAAALRAEPELPMPGLASTAPAQAARANVRPKVDPEAERLRALLTETLRELEELRDLLP